MNGLRCCLETAMAFNFTQENFVLIDSFFVLQSKKYGKVKGLMVDGHQVVRGEQQEGG